MVRYQWIWVLIIGALLIGLSLGSCKGPADRSASEDGPEVGKPESDTVVGENIMESVVAGRFYPGNERVLRREIMEYMQNADVEPVDDNVFGIICPHAGYVYSAPVAAHSYKAVEGKVYDLIVILGPSHYAASGGISVLNKSAYETPLGAVAIDGDASQEIIGLASWADDSIELFRQEHSLEVQLPFVQTVMTDPHVVMIAMGSQSIDLCRNLARMLDQVFEGKRVLYIASTDLSHYHPYDTAREMDLETLEYIEKMDIDGLYDAAKSRRNELCGLGPVLTLMELYKMHGGKDVRILHYANSGDTAGDKSRVVGYGSVVFVGGGREAGDVKLGGEIDFLSKEDKVELLNIARTTVETFVRTGKRPDFDISSPVLLEDGAAFVTLKKQGNLRGCIGQVVAKEPLWQSVREMAVAAASQDPRFGAVQASELGDLHIEISVMTPLELVDDVETIKVGRDGLMIRKKFHQGLLLPQVPVEFDWDRETFLEQTCRKAGLSHDDWKEGAELYRFQAIVFGE